MVGDGRTTGLRLAGCFQVAFVRRGRKGYLKKDKVGFQVALNSREIFVLAAFYGLRVGLLQMLVELRESA